MAASWVCRPMPKEFLIERDADVRDVPDVDGRKAMAKEPEPAKASSQGEPRGKKGY